LNLRSHLADRAPDAFDGGFDAPLLDELDEPRAAASPGPAGLPWITVAPDAPYFVTEDGAPWTPIGQNDAISWVEFKGLFRRRDLPAIESHLRWLKAKGVTCLRLMLEYAQVKHRYFERPVGRFVPDMVTLWDDLFALCERIGLRILLTPFDTFWTWLRWGRHPYNVQNGGPLKHPSEMLLCGGTREAIKARFTFAVERWGGSGALFAWDLWNEIHPAQAGDSADCFGEFIHDLSTHVRSLERRLYGRSHPQTVSLFGPELWWRPHMNLKEPIFRHPDLDFATIHLYREGTIDAPKNTVDPAISTGEIIRDALAEICDRRPFLDTEHGPIHTFKDKRRTLPEAFDDEYFRHMQWAHLASGGAGGGMRWPNRTPHTLTPGMRRAQASLAGFLPLVDWARFRRKNLNQEVKALSSNVACFASGDEAQAVVWLLRRDVLGQDGMMRRDAAPVSTMVRVPGMRPGSYRVTAWDTLNGAVHASCNAACTGALCVNLPPFTADLALAIRRV
jgi:mannan endo-1,4-beta-mannosidase